MTRRAYVDRRRFRLDASTVVRHPNGWLDVWGVATTADAVYDYPEHGTQEFRSREEVLDPSSLSSLHGVPLTIDHPTDDVSTANGRDLTHGWVLDERIEEPTDGTPILVWTQIRMATDDALEAIQAGTIELSCGYDADYEEGAGTAPDGTPYSGTQRRIRYNHVALVELARAGHVARLRLDSAARARKDHAMHDLVIGGHKRRVAKIFADLIASEAAKAKPGIEAKRGRTDAIETSTVSIDGTELILPKAMVDAMMASLGIGAPAPAPTDGTTPPGTEEELTDARGGPPGMGARRGDANAPASAPAPNVDEIVRRHVADAQAAERVRGQIERVAAPILGEAFDYSDPWVTAAAAVSRVDASRETSAKRYADAAAKRDKSGQPTVDAAQAQGRLLAMLDEAVTAHRDARDSSGELGSFIDAGRRADGANGTGTPAKRNDAIRTAHDKMMDRLHGRKPTPAADPKTTGASA